LFSGHLPRQWRRQTWNNPSPALTVSHATVGVGKAVSTEVEVGRGVLDADEVTTVTGVIGILLVEMSVVDGVNAGIAVSGRGDRPPR
jgi:hypothetical protein